MDNTEILQNFVERFGSIDMDRVIWRGSDAFLICDAIKQTVDSVERWRSAGIPIGNVTHGRFHASLALLRMLTPQAPARTVRLDEKSAWLFVCGRDVFVDGVVYVGDEVDDDGDVLITDQQGNNLGLGRYHAPERRKGQVAVTTLIDRGDFLRRER